MNITPDNITVLNKNEIFVFGSNESGRHGAGAAKQALKWGAIYGKGVGIAGQTYAIPTKDKNIQTLPLTDIYRYVVEFINYASIHKELNFLVTRVGCGYAGYKDHQIAPLFREAKNIENIYLPLSFLDVK